MWRPPELLFEPDPFGKPAPIKSRACFSGSCSLAMAMTPPPNVTEESQAMTPEQVSLVQSSFARVAPIADTAAALFYDRLFTIAPPVRQMFKGDMAEQGRKLMATLAVVVNGLTNLDPILPPASALALLHI